MVKEVKAVITLKSGKEVDLPTSKLEHDEERMSKEVKEGSWESRGAQKQGESMACEISQPKVSRCENRLLLRNGFAAAHPPLRKFSQLRRDPMAHECHFAAKYTRFAAAKWLRAFHALRSSVSQPKCHLEGCFAAAKPPFGTRESNSSNGARFGVEMKKLWPFEDDYAKLNGNVAAVPHFATSRASNGARFGVETKKLWPFEDERAKLSGNFAAETPFGRVFCSCETTLWHTSATSQRRTSILQLRNGLQNSLLYKILPPLRKRSPSFKNGIRSSFLCFFLLLA
ncbi:hypothetical protein AAG906_016739 [Vitis piasezkii]